MANTRSASSSMTSTSHTMTTFPAPAKNSKSATATPMANFLEALAPANRHAFIAPSSSLPDASLGFVKDTLDGFAAKLGEEQAERLKEQRKKRKRGDAGIEDGEVLKIRKIYTDGFEVEQVWEQARRVIDALRVDAQRALEELGGNAGEGEEEGESSEGGVELLKFDEDGFEIGSEDESAEDDQEEESGSEMDDAEPEGGEGYIEMSDEELGEDIENDEDEEEGDEAVAEMFVEDPNKLNDGFFSIDQFNKQTEFLEQQDAAADPYTGEASDEEDIDWDADPSNLVAKPVSSSSRAAAMDVEEDDQDAEESEEEGDGPTFGNVDLNAPEGDSEDDEDEEDMDTNMPGDNTNNVLYKDFFEPPPRKASKAEMQASYLERQARKAAAAPVEDEGEVERAIADVRRDLFDDESDQDASEDALSDLDPADPKSRKSAHERRQAKLAEEIRRLEAASVAKREWALSGEARAADRPMNSLLDEDLDFERTGKPVLEVTAEVSESIEELIKRRILAQEFDEVIRRRPDSEDTSANRRGLFELDDTKPQQSLAEMYEEEHVKAHNPDTYVSKSDEKLRKEENEIEGLWKEVSAKLDALSSWHYKPKPAAPSLTVVSDVATISMEDAQPTTASGMSGGQSMLAPQEIYKAGKEKTTIEKGEVVPRTGAPVARQEMSREEKLRRRRREKERIKKRGGEELGQRPESKKTKQKRETIAGLKKGGVKVIGKKGEVRDVEGNKVQAGDVPLNGAGGFKL